MKEQPPIKPTTKRGEPYHGNDGRKRRGTSKELSICSTCSAGRRGNSFGYVAMSRPYGHSGSKAPPSKPASVRRGHSQYRWHSLHFHGFGVPQQRHGVLTPFRLSVHAKD